MTNDEINASVLGLSPDAALQLEIIALVHRAVADEREACAKIVDPPKSAPVSAEARIARLCRESIAAAIRARGSL